MLAIALFAALLLVVTAPIALAVRHFHPTKPSVRRTIGIAYVWGLGVGWLYSMFYAAKAASANGYAVEVEPIGWLTVVAAVAIPVIVSYRAWTAPAITATTAPQH